MTVYDVPVTDDADGTPVRWEDLIADPTGLELTVFYAAGVGEGCNTPTGMALEESEAEIMLTIFVSGGDCRPTLGVVWAARWVREAT